jgi:hypothetical protein
MYWHHRIRHALLSALAAFTCASAATAQDVPGFISSFEPAGPTEITYPAGYTTGLVSFQDGWDSGLRAPRVQTAEEIAAELTAAGLNVAQPVRTGNQAVLVAKIDTVTEVSPPGGYLVRNVFDGLETETKVTADFWARPLTSGLGADPAGTPAGNEKTIGERQGNMFFGIMDSGGGSAERRVAAVRFGVDTVGSDPYTNVVERHIDFGTATAANVWEKSGLLWQADTWYNFRFDMDFVAKTYDFFVNGAKVNSQPIQFYHTDALDAAKFFISRGTNQAGSILDDVRIQATDDFPANNADFDDDGDVDGADFLVWQRNVGTATGATREIGDANADGAVDAADLAAWRNMFPTAVAAAAAIPEPCSLAIAYLALGGVIAVSRNSRARRDQC